MHQADENEVAILDAAGGLLVEVHSGVRMLDVFRQLVHANTRNTQALKAWDELEAAITTMGRAAHPEHYCEACEGKGELMVPGGRCCSGRDCECNGQPQRDYMDTCMACMGRGFLGHLVKPKPKPARTREFYWPGDESLEPTF